MPSVNERSNLMRLLTLYVQYKMRYFKMRDRLLKWVRSHPALYEDAYEAWQRRQERLRLFENLPEYSPVVIRQRYLDLIKDTPFDLIC